MRDRSFVNAALAVEATGFQRIEGTGWAWSSRRVPQSGAGVWRRSVVGRHSAGERRYLNLPCGTMQFIADDDPDIGPPPVLPLIAPVDKLPDMATARFLSRPMRSRPFSPPRAGRCGAPVGAGRRRKSRKYPGAVFRRLPASGN